MKKSTKIVLIIIALLLIFWFLPVKSKQEVVCIPSINTKEGWDNCTTIRFITLGEIIATEFQGLLNIKLQKIN